MPLILERLRTLRVSDAMTKHVVCVSLHQTMAEAAQVLVENEISGAPVVDEQGRCVGVLSATDFVRHQRGATTSGESDTESRVVVTRHHEPLFIEEVRNDLVETHMSPAVQSIFHDAFLLDAAQMMCAAHLHRLPVIDEHHRPVGMITSLDLVAAMLKAAEEARRSK